jgi:hypothetical protein
MPFMTDTSQSQAGKSFVRAVRALASGLSLAPPATVGPAVIAGGVIACSKEEWVVRLLRRHGVGSCRALRTELSRALSRAGAVASVRLHAGLSAEVRGQLVRLRDGKDSRRRLLQTLLSERDDELLWLLFDPVDFFRCYRGVGCRADRKSDLLHRLMRYYGSRLAASQEVLCPSDKGVPRLAIVDCGDSVRAIEQRWDRELQQARDELFTRPIYQRSPLGDCRLAHGPVAADIVAMVLLSGLRLIGRGTPTVTELAGAVSLRHFHRYLAYVHQLVRDELSDQWVSVPDGETWLWFGLPVLPHEGFLREFTGYLADDPIERGEIQEYVSRCETLP